MMKEIDRLRDMALFAEVAKAGSFTKASEVTGVPTSTLSRRITEFEAELRVQLLNRSTRRVTLTETGARYVAQINDFLRLAYAVNTELGSENSTPSGQLRVSMPGDFAVYFVDTLFAQFREAYPQIVFDLCLTAGLPDLAGERFDASIFIGEPPPTARLVARRVIMLNWRLYASKAYLARYGHPETPADLMKHQCLFTPEPDPVRGWVLKNGEATEWVKPTPLMVTNSRGVIRELVAQDMGIGLLGQTHGVVLERTGRIQRVLPDWELEPVPLYIVTTSRLLPARVRVFVDFITQKFEAMNRKDH
ncbi:hypothetical protein CAL29_22685 [Bordetella genomosp. 10]|uniref:HTH lysR-type domain-containing protein n=1 Tax=Bordetella genomosp. 10 TaxID=1416804 RepID=A0A261S1G0_9BORD|nr:LysR family transcriptional regulator [Bordetella genomosp. 10]OZI30792.1 hypothetical protein CAL29_22685 [Bordetella genomosp. 10]